MELLPTFGRKMAKEMIWVWKRAVKWGRRQIEIRLLLLPVSSIFPKFSVHFCFHLRHSIVEIFFLIRKINKILIPLVNISWPKTSTGFVFTGHFCSNKHTSFRYSNGQPDGQKNLD